MKGAAPHRARTSYRRQLTDFEERVLFGLMAGKKYTEMADEWGMKAESLHSAGSRIYDRLGASNKVEAVQMAIKQGVLDRYGFWGS